MMSETWLLPLCGGEIFILLSNPFSFSEVGLRETESLEDTGKKEEIMACGLCCTSSYKLFLYHVSEYQYLFWLKVFCN